VREAEITHAVQRFRKAVDAYGELERDIEQARRNVAEVADRYPALARAQRLFERAARSLEVIGAAVADVPGLASELRLIRPYPPDESDGSEVRHDTGLSAPDSRTGTGEDLGHFPL